MFDKNNLSVRLYALRKAKGVNQATLGESVGVSLHAISKIEKGERAASIEVLCALADYFDVPLDYLTGRGIFENWEKIMQYKDVVLQLLYEQYRDLKSPVLTFRALDDLDEKTLMRVLPAIIERVEVDETGSRPEIRVILL